MDELEAKHREARFWWCAAAVVSFALGIIGYGFGGPALIFADLHAWLFFAALAFYHHGWLRCLATWKEVNGGPDTPESMRLP